MPQFAMTAAIAAVAFCSLTTSPASAHFVLMTPANWANQDTTTGMPEKSAGCGQADPGTPAVASNAVTAFKPGDTVTVTIKEVISHPGWYRAVLVDGGHAALPPDPQVTPGATACGTVNGTTITGLTPQTSPTFPVLVDGALFHTGKLTGPQTFSVKLPINMNCAKCTLQIVEFMSDHPLNNPGGCFYHHCADISIQGPTSDAGTVTDGGPPDATADRAEAAAAGTNGSAGSVGGPAGTSGTAGNTAASGAGGADGAAGTTAGSHGAAGTAVAGTMGTAGTGMGAGGSAGGSRGGSSGGCSLATGSTKALSGSGAVLLFLVTLIGKRGRRSRRNRSGAAENGSEVI